MMQTFITTQWVLIGFKGAEDRVGSHTGAITKKKATSTAKGMNPGAIFISQEKPPSSTIQRKTLLTLSLHTESRYVSEYAE
jgi:hypothetical protein